MYRWCPAAAPLQAYGMMGWRVGYIAYPESGGGELAAQLLKVQDTIPVCPTQLRCAGKNATGQLRGLAGCAAERGRG
jgi:hypothetical protein